MCNLPPPDSKIKIDTLNAHQLIVVPHNEGGVLRQFVGIFLLLWLVAWFAALVGVFSQVFAGKYSALLILWLLGWIAGGTVTINMTYRVFRSSIPEHILLNKPSLSLDTGIPPFTVGFDFSNFQKYWKTIYYKRKRLEFSPTELSTMALRETDIGNKLTIDKGMDRIALAAEASDIEREWLYRYLQQYYELQAR